MTTFRLDECFDDKKFAHKCRKECKARGFPATVKGFPKSHKGKDDPAVLTYLMRTDEPLLTKDKEIASLHALSIPDGSPGIVIITNAPGTPQTMTIRRAEGILQDFKVAFAEWHSISLRNSVLTITQVGVDVQHVIGGRLISDDYLPRTDEWQTRLSALLAINANRT